MESVTRGFKDAWSQADCTHKAQVRGNPAMKVLPPVMSRVSTQH